MCNEEPHCTACPLKTHLERGAGKDQYEHAGELPQRNLQRGSRGHQQ